jgi:hypothetical protein
VRPRTSELNSRPVQRRTAPLNAAAQPRLEAGAERTLEGVGCSRLLGAVWLATRPSSSELLKAHRNDFMYWGSRREFDTGERELFDLLLQSRIVPEAARQIMAHHGRFV